MYTCLINVLCMYPSHPDRVYRVQTLFVHCDMLDSQCLYKLVSEIYPEIGIQATCRRSHKSKYWA